MKLEVEIISTETIKPSSPTPHHLRHYQLSFLDQISPPVYNPLILFYPSDQINNNITEFSNVENHYDHLKQSLSEVLTCFYPLAGRIKDNVFIDCNDQGIPFKKARVKSQLSDHLQNPVPGEHNKLLPLPLDDAGELPVGIQFNIFNCGGIAISVLISHKVGDALSFFTFVKSWAAIARGERDTVRVEFVSAVLFPPKNISGFKPNTGITKENIAIKRFVFSAQKIEEIRAKYTDTKSLENQKRPSRVEALSAFMWSRFVAATKGSESGPDHKFHAVVHAVNLRPRIEPPLPDYSFGNLYRIAMTIPSMETDHEECYDLISQMRESLSKVNKEYVKKLQDGNEHLDFIKERAERFLTGEMVSLNFTSLCRFPLYEADFSWGKPVWVGSARLTFKNLVTFMDTVSGDGIEAWINLRDEDMAKFEIDEELLAFVD
ncbi:Vinorine synthase-like [Melia azedarach]|uniref:Vinorine synthase-like n=1 Tax=Melia azedarach TaxID=155640 RepID=A0ACC1XIG4_MELAZ|nr:Vinorine synthase-like [Melia azedarach]